MNNQDIVQANSRQRLIDAAKRYAQADRSDPFAYNRAMSSIVNGISTPEAHYDATIGVERRSYTKADGTKVEYTVPSYSNIKRV